MVHFEQTSFRRNVQRLCYHTTCLTERRRTIRKYSEVFGCVRNEVGLIQHDIEDITQPKAMVNNIFGSRNIAIIYSGIFKEFVIYKCDASPLRTD